MWLGCCGVSNLQVLLETRQSAWLKWHVEEHALDEILDEIFWVLTMFLFTFHTMSVANTGNFLEVGSFWLGSGSRRGQQLIERQKERGRVSRDTHSMEIPESQPNHQPSQTTIVALAFSPPPKLPSYFPGWEGLGILVSGLFRSAPEAGGQDPAEGGMAKVDVDVAQKHGKSCRNITRLSCSLSHFGGFNGFHVWWYRDHLSNQLKSLRLLPDGGGAIIFEGFVPPKPWGHGKSGRWNSPSLTLLLPLHQWEAQTSCRETWGSGRGMTGILFWPVAWGIASPAGECLYIMIIMHRILQ